MQLLHHICTTHLDGLDTHHIIGNPLLYPQNTWLCSLVHCVIAFCANRSGTSFNILSFCRLVYDRETGKPKGYGFCEYQDQETALSAMRNLNGREFNGRALRVDNAASEKNKEELKSEY